MCVDICMYAYVYVCMYDVWNMKDFLYICAIYLFLNLLERQEERVNPLISSPIAHN